MEIVWSCCHAGPERNGVSLGSCLDIAMRLWPSQPETILSERKLETIYTLAPLSSFMSLFLAGDLHWLTPVRKMEIYDITDEHQPSIEQDSQGQSIKPLIWFLALRGTLHISGCDSGESQQGQDGLGTDLPASHSWADYFWDWSQVS